MSIYIISNSWKRLCIQFIVTKRKMVKILPFIFDLSVWHFNKLLTINSMQAAKQHKNSSKNHFRKLLPSFHFLYLPFLIVPDEIDIRWCVFILVHFLYSNCFWCELWDKWEMSHKICRLLFKIGAECLIFMAFIFIDSIEHGKWPKFPFTFQKLVFVPISDINFGWMR